MSADDVNEQIAEIKDRWEDGEATDEEMQAAINLYDALPDDQKKLMPESIRRGLDIAASKISLARKKSAHLFAVVGEPPPGKEDVGNIIANLATLSPIDYDQQRKTAAAKTGMRLPTLDAAVDAIRKAMPEPDKSKLAPRLPSTTAVDGDELIADLLTDLTRYVIIDHDCATATAFWVLHTYLVNHTYITPRLFITAPQRGCGKSTLVDWLTTVVQKPLSSVNISAAHVFHVVEADQPTIIIDEADTFLKLSEELRGILNSGHKKGGYVHRYDPRARAEEAYSTFSAVALSLIGNLPSTLQDRSVRVRLRRKTSNEKITSLRLDKVGDDLARRCARWALDNQSFFANADPTIPDELQNRVADNWRPLIALADIVGGEWPTRLREIAVRIAALDAGEDISAETQFLQNTREAFGDQVWLSSGQLLRGMLDNFVLSSKALANRVKPYGITPGQVRFGDRVERGYWARDFADTWKRYLPDVPDVPDVPDTDSQVEEVEDLSEPARATGTNGTSGTRQ